jgi:serine phosphatase RsbU (regulator of sigma subunit)
VDYENDVSVLQKEATGLFNENKFTEAAETIDKALNLLSVVPSLGLKGSVNITAGTIYARLERYDIALNSFLKAADCYEKLNDSLSLSNINYQIAHLYYGLQAYTKAIEYFNKHIQILPKKNHTLQLMLRNDEFLANCFFNIKGYETAELIYKSLYRTYSENSQDELSVASINNIVITLEKQKKYEEAINYLRILFGIYNNQNRRLQIIEVLNNIGYDYVLLKNYEEAKKSFISAEKELGKASYSYDFLASLYTNIGICYQNTDDSRNAISYLIGALQIRENEKNYAEIATVNNILALTYYVNDDIYNALEYSVDAIEAAENTPNPALKSQCYRTYSTILQAAEDHQKALDYYKLHLSLQDSILRAERKKMEELDERIFQLEKSEKELKLKIVEENVKDILLEQLQLKAIQREQENEILKKEKELQESEKERIQQSLVLVKQQNQALLQKKEIEALERERTIKENELKLKESQEKEQAKAYELLKSEKEKQTLELQKQDLILEKQVEKEKRFIWMMTLAVVIIILIIIFLILTKKKNKILSLQKKEIEDKNEELTAQKEEIRAAADNLQDANKLLVDKNAKIEQQSFHIISSIQYAKRIQQAVLPQRESIKELIPSHFILFRPRDIVSGDFYWVKQIENYIYFAVADCTGHGVPGAFMSMLGTAFLNEITGKGEVIKPAEILNELRDKVKKSLRQVGKSGEAKDGMDMVLIMIDLESKELTFAGANNSIIHIRSNGNMGQPIVIKLKGDSMPIGIGLKENEFTSHTIKLLPNDMIYLYTDGFVDQMGGPRRSKFMTRNFVNLLQNIFEKSPKEQKHTLNTTLKDWMGDCEQLDDILVVGINFTDVYGEVNLF